MNNNNFDTFNFEIFASVNEMFKNEMKKNDDTLANKNFYSKMIILKFKDGVVTFLTKLEKEIAESWLKKKKSLIIRVLNKILDSNVNTIVYKCEKNNKESVVTAQVKLPIDKEIYEPTASDLTGESKRQQTLPFLEESIKKTNEQKFRDNLNHQENESYQDEIIIEFKHQDQYTFQNYLFCSFNQNLMSVKNLIIEGDKTYPVVVIFGKPGFGKTHFLYALANEMLENEKSVSLFTPKYFSTEIQLLLQTNNQTKLKKIREKLISVDLLIFDDFQVFSDGNKRATIDFLFDVFDARINLKKHTMFATDRNIALFKNVFADNLFSRLRLAIEIELDKPTKKDIEKLIYFIIEQKNLDKSLWEQDAIDYVVAHQSDSIRSLIGAIDNANFKLLQRNNLFYREPETTISKDDIKEVYSELEKRKIENYTPENIILNACQYYKVQKKDVLGRKRRKDINNARHVAMYMIRKELDVPLQKIGTIFNKNHSSVIYVIEKMEKDIESEQSLFQEVINTINEQLLKNS